MQRADRWGYAALLFAVIVWAAWFPFTRLALTQGIEPLGLAFLRYSTPAIILIPLWSKVWPKLRQAPLWTLIAMLGWGTPFAFLVSAGMRDASISIAAALVPCQMPLIALALERMIFGTKVHRWQAPGFLLIGLAAILIFGLALFARDGPTVQGILLLVLGATGWAAFALGFKRSGLTPLEAAAYFPAVSTLLILPFIISDNPFEGVSSGAIGFQVIAQGVFSGLLATVAFGIGIARIGTARAATFTVLVPALAAIMATVTLGEAPGLIDALALLLGSIGVGIVNGVWRRRGDA